MQVIALACGYHGNEHFCRQFKEKTGVTPGHYREEAWTAPTNYTYDKTTGAFASVAGQITVPAATYTRDPVTESLIINSM